MERMVRTFAGFAWDVPVPEGGQPPYARPAVEALLAALRAVGLDVSPVDDLQYAWGFSCRLPHLRVDCQLGPVGSEQGRWLLACYPWRGWADWWHDRWREDEQEHFVQRVDSVLKADRRVAGLRWYTRQEWDGRGAE